MAPLSRAEGPDSEGDAPTGEGGWSLVSPTALPIESVLAVLIRVAEDLDLGDVGVHAGVPGLFAE